MYSSIKNKNRDDTPLDDDHISDGVNDANSQKNDDQPPLPDVVQTPEKQEPTQALLPDQNEDAKINLDSARPLLQDIPPQNNLSPVEVIPENQNQTPIESKPEDVKIEIKGDNKKSSDLGVPLTNVLLPSQFSQSASAEKLLVQLTWKNVTIKVNEVKRVKFKKVSSSKIILENLSGTVYPGQFLAILGSTGAGKTTLLNFLSGKMFSPNLIKQGEVFLNGVARDKIDYPKFTAFVQQDDVFMECLTIEECLSFTARCKCPGTDAVLKKRVDDLMEELSLTPIKDQRIGGSVTKGEKKRTAIGIELITKPALVFLDEPTSGMDSLTAMKVIEVVAKLAKRGRTVVAVIHQPNSQIFQMFDQLMLLSLGNIIYFNAASKASEYFAKINYPCDERVNPAEHFMQIMSSETLMNKLDPKQKEELEAMEDNEIQNKYKDLIMEFVKNYNETKEYKCNDAYVYPYLSDFKKDSLKQYTPPWCKQFGMLMKREGKRISRDKRTMKAKILTSTLLGVFMILIYHKMGTLDYNGFQNFAGFFMMMAMNLVMAGISNAIQVFPDLRVIFMREQSSGQYSVSSYYLSYFITSFPFAILIPTIVIIVGYLITFAINGMEITVKKAFIFWAACILVYLTSEAYGLFISASFSNKNMIMPLFPMLVVPLMLLSGFYVDLDKVVHFIRELQYLSPYKYAFNLFGRNYLEDMKFTFTVQGHTQTVPGTYFLEKMSAKYQIWECFLALCCIFLVLHVLAFVMLKCRAKKVG